jgi:16S rRNA (uracil1498-N3)-methyltransferase
VTPPLFLVDELSAGDQIRLGGDEGRHAARVRRLGVGEDVLIGDGRGAVAECTVAAVDGDVELLTELGVDEIVPWSAARAIAQWQGPRGAKSLDRWRRVAREAAKQSRRAWVPHVADLASTGQVCERMRAATAALVLQEQGCHRLGEMSLPAGGELVLVVGPEGGITEDELVAFGAAGAVSLRLGEPVMRTSTAGAAALAAVSVGLGRW